MVNSPVITTTAEIIKVATRLRIDMPLTVYVGDTIDIAGFLEAFLYDRWEGLAGKEVVLGIIKPDGSPLARHKYTLEHGEYYWSVLIDQVGTWQFWTYFAGDDYYEKCWSPVRYPIATEKPVVKKQTQLTISAPTSGRVGELISVFGQLLDVKTGAGVNGKMVSLTARRFDGTKVSPTPYMYTYPNPATLLQGFYIFDLTLDMAGLWSFQTYFAGDEEYEGCEKEVVTGVSPPPPELGLPAIAAAVLAVADVVLVGYYLTVKSGYA